VLALWIAGPAAAVGGEGRTDAPARPFGRGVLRPVRAGAFGFVEQRAVDLVSLRLVLGVAQRCRQWPLRSPDRDVLRRPDVVVAGCRLRRYQGEVPLVLVDRQGQRHQPLPPLHTDRDGRVAVQFTALDHALRVLGEGSLDDYARIELGEEGWAGHVDLETLLRFRADWHLVWLARGRGAPGLFVVRHPEHPGADDARTLSADAFVARQTRDYERVEAGELSAQAFLERHPLSPYRRRVEAMLRARSMMTAPTKAQREGAGAAGDGAAGAAGPAAPDGGEAGASSAGAGASTATGATSPAGGGRRGGTSGGSGP
jgi:hypothetical protein